MSVASVYAMNNLDHVSEHGFMNWWRCRRVQFDDGVATWELDESGRYSFSTAYQEAPHIQLANATNDESLREFVKTWGPLRSSVDSMVGTDFIEVYQEERDLLRADVQLMASIQQPEFQRPALLEKIKYGWKRESGKVALFELRMRLQLPWKEQSTTDADLREWAEQAPANQIERACALLLSPRRKYQLELRVERTDEGSSVRAWPSLSCLTDALHWMTWLDVLYNRPIRICTECQTLFQPAGQRAAKSCGPQCGNRRAGREYYSRLRKKYRS
jgi:hypothetical protein